MPRDKEPKVFLDLTREDAREIAQSFKELLDDPRVSSVALYFNPDRFTTRLHTPRPNVHPFIAVGCDPVENDTYY